MRHCFGFAGAILLAGTFAAYSQQPPAGEGEAVAERFGVSYKGETFPQTTAKQTLASVILALERGRSDYLVAYLLEPTFLEAQIAERARLLEGPVEAELLRQRDAQRLPGAVVPDSARLSDDPVVFRTSVQTTAAARAVRQVMRDVQNRIANDPETIRLFRRFLRDGMFEDTDTTSKATLPDVKDRAAYFKKVGTRWFMENRQTEAPAAAAPMPAPGR